MITDICLAIKNLIWKVTELFIRGRKLNIFLVFIIQSCFDVPKNIRLNSALCFVTKIPNKRELQQIAFNHSSNIDFQDFFVSVIHSTLTSDMSSCFRKKSFRKNIKTNNENWWKD